LAISNNYKVELGVKSCLFLLRNRVDFW